MGKAEYNTENCNGFSISEMLSLFRTHETVTFVLPGLGMTEAETVLFKNAITELERLAKIGKATEYLLNCRYTMALATKEQINCTEGGICITDVDSVVDLYDGMTIYESEESEC